MTDDIRPSVQEIATELATWYGSAYSHQDPHDRLMHTVASAAGYGRFHDAPAKYAAKHWDKFRGAAEYVIRALYAKDREIERLRQPMTPDRIEVLAIRAALGNNGGTWAEHYTEDQKEHWRQWVRDMAAAMKDQGRTDDR